MWNLLKNIWLGVVLIGAASALLLVSDCDRRQKRVENRRKTVPRLAVIQWASTDLLDNTVAGIVQGLRSQGFEDGSTASIRFFNASGDNATGNMMATELVGGGYDMVLTASTLAMQAVASANRDGRVMHLFGGVTDPYGAGVGITGPEPHQHPPHLLGVGTFQPVDASIRIAKLMNPDLKRIGVVWNPAEDNSEACVRVARKTCLELGITLVEANAGNTSETSEAIRSVLSRRVDAVWIGGDTVAIASINAIVSAARNEGVPVFSNDPSDVRHGALFGMGASYEQVGIAVGELGGKVLNGADPLSFGVANLVPEVLALNEELAAELENWAITAELRSRAKSSLLSDAPETDVSSEKLTFNKGRLFNLVVVNLVESRVLTLAQEGLLRGLREAGLEKDRDFLIRYLSAQGDIAQLPMMLDAALQSDPDVIVTITTPALMAAVKKVHDVPLVFTVASDPAVLGLFTEETRPANITGVHDDPPVDRLLEMALGHNPGIIAVGIVFDPAQPNSVISVEKLRVACKQRGIKLYEATASTVTDLATATQSVVQRGACAIMLSADNLVTSGFPVILKTAKLAEIPVYATSVNLVEEGATGAVGDDYESWGAQSGLLVAKILAGVPPVKLPVESTSTHQVVDPAIDSQPGFHGNRFKASPPRPFENKE